MTLDEFRKWIGSTEVEYKYQLLSRMKSDCLYFLGFGNGKSRLWGGTINEHLDFMKTLYSMIIEKPEWLTEEEMEEFKKRMIEIAKRSVQ